MTIEIEGLSNFRDFGGVDAGSGGKLRSGRMFRSAHSDGLTAAGVSALKALGVEAVVDLRGDGEIDISRSGELERRGIRRIRVPIEPLGPRLIAESAAQEVVSADALHQIMVKCYQSYVAERAHCLASALNAVLGCADRPFLIHCFGGKDRTGVVVFLLLTLLGVSRKAILDDYLRTNLLWDRREGAPPGVDQSVFDQGKETRLEHLDAFLGEADARFGSLQGFMDDGLGFGDEKTKLLRQRLLVF